eukprot:jgi/Botrbrau1/23334/Bobra.0823s0001.1
MPLQRRSGFAAARWYKEVTVKPHDIGGWGIWLDGRGLRTPARNLLRLPNYPLAMAVAAEWQWQKEGKVRTSTMPLNALAATAIDQDSLRSAFAWQQPCEQLPFKRGSSSAHVTRWYVSDTQSQIVIVTGEFVKRR